MTQRVLLFGATGTAGRAVAAALAEAGHDTVAVLRPGTLPPSGTNHRIADPTDPRALSAALANDRFDAAICCLASRSGVPADAWAVDHRATINAIAAAQAAGAAHFVLLSAICVQKPRLAFQRAKLAAEAHLMASGLEWSIVRPTAFFKSLSGQVARVRAGKPFLVFGDGRLTACKPISDTDLGRYIVGCLTDPARRKQVLPIGGPGPAITPVEQGKAMFEMLGKPPRYKHVPPTLLKAIGGGLALAGKVSTRAAAKAELARIGQYYATESMLVWDAKAGRYDADATPSFGKDTLFDHYRRLIDGEETTERGAHAVF